MFETSETIIARDGGQFAAHRVAPAAVRAPGLLVVHEIFGVNPTIRKLARFFAENGFVALAPELFWRLEPGVALGYTDPERIKARGLNARFDYETGINDLQSTIDHLRRDPACDGRVLLTGFCFGGTMAYLGAARCTVDAAVAYYGTHIHVFSERAAEIRCPLILHIGEKDHTTPPEAIERILHAVAPNANITPYLYADTPHAFCNMDRPEYHRPETARLAHARTFNLFRGVNRR